MPKTDEMRTYRGSYHCGRVQFEIRTDLKRVSECNCSICRRKAYLHHMVSPDRFRLLQGVDALATYQFGTGRLVPCDNPHSRSSTSAPRFSPPRFVPSPKSRCCHTA